MFNRYCAATQLAAALVFLLAGCEKGPQLPTCYPVSGRVLIDGEPAVRATVTLHPEAAQPDGKKYGGSTITDDDGAFRMTTFTAGDGVPAGDYTVTIVANWMTRNGQDVGVPDLLGGQYAKPEKSTLKVSVLDEPVVLETYELKRKSSK